MSLGFGVSAIAGKTAAAMGVAVFLWLVSVFLSDLGLIGTAVVLRLSPRALLWLSLLNPAKFSRSLFWTVSEATWRRSVLAACMRPRYSAVGCGPRWRRYWPRGLSCR